MAAAAAATALLVTYTLFPDVSAQEKTVRCDVPWEELVQRIRNAATYLDKAHCPLISMAEYGDTIDDRHKSLRYAENVQRVHGIEIDYDGGEVTLAAAQKILADARLLAVLYTSPSHTLGRPRWRALLPLSEAALPEKRAEYVGRANRVLGGIASRESFTLSQSFYIGRVRGAEYEVGESGGRCIDMAADIDPQYAPGADPESKGERDQTTDTDLRASFDRGEDRYTAMLKLSSRWAARGLDVDGIEQNLLEMLGNAPRNADGIDLRTRARPLAESAVRKFGETRRPTSQAAHAPHAQQDAPLTPEVKPAPRPGRSLPWAQLIGKEPPQREWIIPYWLPASHITLLSGKGGIGKSLLAQHLATALAVGADYLEKLAPKRVLMWAAEDDVDELWRRQLNISSYLDAPLPQLENFTLRSCVGCDVTLASLVFSAIGPTPLLDALREEVNDLKAELVILDNVARVYGGNENDRHQVTTFLAWVQAACSPAAVLLLGHPAKMVGSEFSGSSAWEGAVRARLYFSDRPPDQPDEDGAIDPSVRYLSRRKANYSDLEMRMMHLRDGALMPQDPPRAGRRKVGGDFCREIVRRAVSRLAERSIFGTASTSSPNYLPKLAQQYGLLEEATEGAFGGAMRQMLMDGSLKSAPVGQYPNRTPKMGLVAAQVPGAQMGGS